MSKRVWKYEFHVQDGVQVKSIPAGAKVVFVDIDPIGFLCAWFEVDPNAEKELREFKIHGTGHPIDENEEHVGSTVRGAYVWHLYEVKDTVDQYGPEKS